MRRAARAALVLLVAGTTACPPEGRRDAGGNVEDSAFEAAPETSTPAVEAGDAPGDVVTPDAPADAALDAPAANDVIDASAADAVLDVPDAAAPLDAPADTLAPPDVVPDRVVVDVPDVFVPPDVRDASTTPVAYGQPCSADSRCEASAGETGRCSDRFGTPVCIQSCDGAADYAACAGGAGICLPTESGRVCAPKCGDHDDRRCGPGASCSYLGQRRNAGGEFAPVGVCAPDCSGSGIDACSSGYSCDRARRTCERPGCPSGCPMGTTCDGTMCAPSAPIPLYGVCDTRAIPGRTNGCAGELCIGGDGAAGFCSTQCNTLDGPTWCGDGVCWTDNSYLERSTADTLAAPGGGFNVVGGRTFGVCLKGCSDTVDCPAGFHCAEYSGRRACLPGAFIRGGATTAPLQPGGICRANTDCASGRCAFLTGFADGVCQRAAPGMACPAGTVPLSDGFTCVKSCTGMAPGECDGSWVCDTSTNTCAAGICRDTADCQSAYRCDHDRSTCVMTPPSTTMRAAIGSPCARDEDCASNSCATQRTTSGGVLWSGGYCSSPCIVHGDFSDTCPAGAFCNGSIVQSGICLDLCDTLPTTMRYGSCRATGYRCQPFQNDGRYGACVPVVM